MSSKRVHLFDSSPDWAAYLAQCPEKARSGPVGDMDIPTSRTTEDADDLEWSKLHPPSAYGFSKRDVVIATDQCPVNAAVYLPLAHSIPPASLPVLFVTHGGGYIGGTSVTEERWLLADLLAKLGPVVAAVSVEYRLAPEHPYPIPIDDCWQALRSITSNAAGILGPAANGRKIILAGSSAGGGAAAALAQRARDFGLHNVTGVVLNVPMLCHPDCFPLSTFEMSSYEQCNADSQALLTGELMRQVWAAYMATSDKKEEASPLLYETKDLPPHAVFVAGQDPLRDDGLAYAEKLQKSGVNVEVRIYPGVPHTFSQIWDLASTQKFQLELASCVQNMIKH